MLGAGYIYGIKTGDHKIGVYPESMADFESNTPVKPEYFIIVLAAILTDSS